MLHTHGILEEEVSKSGRFDVALFKQRVIDVTHVGGKICPSSLVRLAKQLGAHGSNEQILKHLSFSFNSSDARLKRKRGEGCYVYERIK